MERGAGGAWQFAPARRRRQPRASTSRLCPECRAEVWRILRHAATIGLLALLILALAGLGSYDLDASKPDSPNLPVERICPHRFQMTKDQASVQVPMCLNAASLDDANRLIEHAVIVVHGNSRNATSSYAAVEAATQAADRQDVLVVAPQFLAALDLEAHDPAPDLAVWRTSGWSQGDRSVADAPTGRPSSFEVLDAIVEQIGRPDRSPNLRQVTVAGHSAGGQFVQRYAAGTRIEQQPTIAAGGVRFRYVVANPSSYMYLFPREPDALTQRCPRFDEYKFGLTDLNVYLRPLGLDGIREGYARKDVTVLLGRLDHELLDPSKDDSCEALVQGAHRVNRGIRYVQHLDQQYGSGQHGTRLVIVPGAGHSARAMFTSPEGRATLLGP